MPIYNLAALAQIDRSYEGVAQTLRTEGIKEVARAFVSNANRVIAAAVLPVRVLNLAVKFLPEYDRARRRLIPNYDSLSFVEKHERELAKREQIVGECKACTPAQLSAIEGHHEDKQRRWEAGLAFIDAMAEKSADFLRQGLDSALSGMAVAAWTTFETLAGDLWVASVNAQPAHLASLRGDARRIEKRIMDKRKPPKKESASTSESQPAADRSGDAPGPPSQKQVTLGSISKVTQGKYDLRDKMGSLLAEGKQVQFTRLEAIRAAYSLAFVKVRGVEPERIDVALANRALDALSAVRNVIVHKAGVADAWYVDDAKDAPAAPRLKEGDVLRLEAEMVRTLVEPVIQSCAELLSKVDAWLSLTRRASGR